MNYKLLVDGELIDGAKSVAVINPATARNSRLRQEQIRQSR